MRSAALVLSPLVMVVLLSSMLFVLPASAAAPHGVPISPSPPSPDPASPSPPAPKATVGPSAAPSSAVSTAFDQRVRATAASLAEAGVPAREVRLPYVGPSAQVVDGTVVPGYEVAAQEAAGGYGSDPAPSGIAYYGLNATNGTPQSTILNASGVAGSLTVTSMQALYLDVDTPDLWGIQLNAVLGNVTLAGTSGYEFWVQNAVDVYQHNNTINLGDDTWNFSSPGAELVPGDPSILSHSPNGSITGGLYVGLGPWIHAPLPFALTLYVNSSLTAAHDQELWYNYSVRAAGGLHESGNYDWIVFNSGGGATVPIAPFVADGGALDPVGLPNDYEFDFGIGGFNGATMDTLATNMSATLDYCPLADASCSAGELRSVPAALDYGGETGETASGIAETYSGTTVTATAGPEILRPLWGYPGTVGATAGSTPVTNEITVSGSPDPSAVAPYVFVFLQGSSAFDTAYEWSPDVPVWHLAAGSYRYEVMLADYDLENGSLTVGATPTSLSVDLTYDVNAGVYTPLWAFSNAEFAGISTAGDGTLGHQYRLFNNPTSDCSGCGGAANNTLEAAFFDLNDYLYPVYPGVLFDGTNAYAVLNSSVSYDVYSFAYGLGTLTIETFYLQLELVSTQHVTITNDSFVGGWPAMYETLTLAGTTDPAQNPFPVANLMVWNSSDDLIAGNTFVPEPVVPDSNACFGFCPQVICYGCVSPDGLLLYGGSNNTVWGNTFRDPTGASGAPYAVYAGLAEAESGDFVYNNNFSIDNPTVYLPYDIYSDACPDGYAGQCGPLVPPAYNDTWNVTNQSAAAVSATVNGFALSGNVLGASCPWQGGNFWSDYGNPLNPTGLLPFTNRYNYDELTILLPNGSSTVQSSMRVGGDYLPLPPGGCPATPHFDLRLQVSGLARGAEWGVGADGAVPTTTEARSLVVVVPQGIVRLLFSEPAGFGVARLVGKAAVTATTADITAPSRLTVQFGPIEAVSFAEVTRPHWAGLPNGTSWGVVLAPKGAGEPAGATLTTSGTSVTFALVKGSHFSFDVQKPSYYRAAPASGSLTVAGHATTKGVRFQLLTASVHFTAYGLPRHASWSISLTSSTPGALAANFTATGATLRVSLTNGTYSFTAVGPGGLTASGSFVVTAPTPASVFVGFGP